jgi:hypothetical protein
MAKRNIKQASIAFALFVSFISIAPFCELAAQPAQKIAVRQTDRGAGFQEILMPSLTSKCENPKSDEDLNLCVQWMSVTESRRANSISQEAQKLSYESLIWTKYGFFSIIFTLLLTAWAALSTRRSAKNEEKLLEGLHRPYLVVEPIFYNFFQQDHPDFGKFQYTIRNIGGSPAIFRTFHESLRFEPNEISNNLKFLLGGSNPWIIAPQESMVRTIEIVSLFMPFDQLLSDDSLNIWWRVNIDYVDLFESRRHFFFEKHFWAGQFWSNDPPIIRKVAFDLHKWRRWKNKFSMIWVPVWCAVRDRFTDKYKMPPAQ